jgi:hypothetical protein
VDCPPLDMLEDGELIARWREGEGDALTALVRRYDRRLRAFIYMLTQDSDATSDFAQTTWLRVAEWADVASNGNFYGALCAIARCRVGDARQLQRDHARIMPLFEASGMQSAGCRIKGCQANARAWGLCVTHNARRLHGWKESELNEPIQKQRKRKDGRNGK